MKFCAMSLLIALFASAAAFAGPVEPAKPEVAQPTTVPVAWVQPAGVQQIAGCFDTQGFHYARPVDMKTFPAGPIYTVANGRLISVEYVFAQSDFAKSSVFLNKKFLYLGHEVPIQHVDVMFMPDLFPVPVFTMHFYLVTHQEDRAIKCP
ncbi:MAG TPA: hypothetical protein VLR94_05310 [Acidobacteriota bacterium]|nr:hypothetical protein [Acidobacteriota bacterium]